MTKDKKIEKAHYHKWTPAPTDNFPTWVKCDCGVEQTADFRYPIPVWMKHDGTTQI